MAAQAYQHDSSTTYQRFSITVNQQDFQRTELPTKGGTIFAFASYLRYFMRRLVNVRNLKEDF